MPSLAKILPRWYWTVRAEMNSRVAISGLDSPSRASRAIWASWAVRSSFVAAAVRLRAVSPVARSRALLSEGDVAERQYQEAIARLGSAPAGAELARAHLLYGEWLRSEDRRVEARKHLQVAHGMLQEMKIGAFGDRARRELAAASGARRARPPRIPSVGDALTEQEAQIARLAQAGLSNPEIGTRLFISARTVQYHLGKVFTKLGITSRNQLQWALSARREPVPVWAVTTAS